jgi:TolB protein
MKTNKLQSFYLLFLLISFSTMQAQNIVNKVGSFDNLSIIGASVIPGTAKYNEIGQTYRLTNSGSNIWFGHDTCTLLWKKMNGDFIIQTRAHFIGTGHELHRKAGIMIRKTEDSSSPVISCTVHGDGLTSLQYRSNAGEDMKEIKFVISAPDVLQIEKKGNAYTMSVAHFGEVYEIHKLENVDLGTDLLTGLFICSHNSKFSEEAEFSNVRVFNTAPDKLVPYKEYLGSLLEVMDVASGQREILASAPGSWQAPNWTPDGKKLIYNADGKLYNFLLSTKVSTVLNTDFASNNNNDHVLTFDGKQVGISNAPAETKVQSVVYSVPVGGGVPKKITLNSP